MSKFSPMSHVIVYSRAYSDCFLMLIDHLDNALMRHLSQSLTPFLSDASKQLTVTTATQSIPLSVRETVI